MLFSTYSSAFEWAKLRRLLQCISCMQCDEGIMEIAFNRVEKIRQIFSSWWHHGEVAAVVVRSNEVINLVFNRKPTLKYVIIVRNQ